MKGLKSYVSQNDFLPSHSSAIIEKHQLTRKYSLFTYIAVQLPFPLVRNRKLRVTLPVFSILHRSVSSRPTSVRSLAVLALGLFVIFYTILSLHWHFTTEAKQWLTLSGDSRTLVFAREDLKRIWEWEITSGHFPSNHRIPAQIGMTLEVANPALPPRKKSKILPSRYRPPPKSVVTNTRGVGANRVYLDIQSRPPDVAYPPRPVPGSIADLDVIMELCDFSLNKYVRDCLETLRVGGGLDNGNHLRRGSVDDWKYIYMEDGAQANITEATPDPWVPGLTRDSVTDNDYEKAFRRKENIELEKQLHLSEPLKHRTYQALESSCDPDHPRIFHMFWTGPFTDKPYLALLSYLFTQNLGLHLPSDEVPLGVCRPQFWLWINPGPAASVPNPSARQDMLKQLKANPWASPFLHPRFKDAIQFKLWNTTEQLDGIPELKDEWRALRDSLFNSGGHVISVPGQNEISDIPSDDVSTGNDTLSESAESGVSTKTRKVKTEDDNLLNRLGSKSSNSYDRLSVILSDMARFVLCHRFGGTYLDADTIFLRDWEELWGWKGAFAYRWSRLEKYNTAVLRMNKNSALGTFLFRTALRNGLDFHPMTVSLYTKDAFLEGLLLRLPDALFDSAWLNTEYYQRDRPPQPYFAGFEDFFDTPLQSSAGPQALGFDGFFKGAYSYHFHNFWWKPFDPSRNWPDLGNRFAEGERVARAQAIGRGMPVNANLSDDVADLWGSKVSDDKRDLDWATVLKRTFESYVRGERPNMYGEWLKW